MTGWSASFLRLRTGKQSGSLRELYAECSAEERRFDGAFYELYLAGRGTGALTPFAGIARGAGPLAGEAGVPMSRDAAGTSACATTSAGEWLRGALIGAFAGTLEGRAEVDVAVSGGIDSWVLAAILRGEGYRVRGWYLETGIPGYCEREQADCFARALGIRCRHVRATARDFVEALRDFVAATETPIYNLHPVSKWLLAKALRSEGVETVVTGDGADQVMRQERDCDLLPLTLTCFRKAGVRVVTPFLAESVMGLCRRPDPEKRPVRELARRLAVPDVAKRVMLFPEVPLPVNPRAVLPTALGDYRISCLSYTTGLLLQVFEEEHERCAESPA